MADWGMDPESAAKFRAFHTGGEPAVVDVYRPNEGAFNAFVAAMSQVRLVVAAGIAGGSVLATGLDYAAAKVAWDAHGITLGPELMQQIQIMEAAYCRALQDA